jgi:hypothetical protein
MLKGLTLVGGSATKYHAVAEGFLTYPQPLSTQDVALELMIGGLGVATKDVPPRVTEAVTEQFEVPAAMGVALGEEQDYILAPLSRDAQHRLARMNWLKGLDLNNVKGRKVHRDGSHVATIIDLTVAHKVLRELKQAVEQSPVRDQFWTQLAGSVAAFAALEKVKRIPTDLEKVPTYYGGNIHADENLLRYYFVSLGEALSGAKIVGLVAALRGKTKQLKVLNIISHARQRIPE